MKKYLKVLMIIALAVLLVGTTFAATYAWLTAKTDTITNTFTAGKIEIDLKETKGTEYKMVPGVNIEKDPKVTVKADSEKCWLFVKIEETNFKINDNDDDINNDITFMTYEIDTGWTKLKDGVYYRVVDSTNANQDFNVIKNNLVTVKSETTKDQFNALNGQKPTLTITAYAVQHSGFATAAAAWAEAENLG